MSAFTQQIVEQREAAVRQVVEMIREEAYHQDIWGADLRSLATRLEMAAPRIARDWRTT